MPLYLQQLVNGVLLGAEYALFAVGLVLVFGVLRTLNFAHGSLFGMGGLAAVVVANAVGAAVVPVGLIAGCVVGAAAAGATQLVVFETVQRRRIHNEMVPAAATVGISWILVGIAEVAYGPDARSFPFGSLPSTVLNLGPVQVSQLQLVIIGVSALGLVALDVVVRRSRLGRQLRAVAHTADNAELLGIDVHRVRTRTLIISGGLAGIAGAITALSLGSASPYFGDGMLLNGFAIIVLGGLGSVHGAVLGALLLGIAEVGVVQAGLDAYREAVPGIMLIVVLMIRPSGIFGINEVHRA